MRDTSAVTITLILSSGRITHGDKSLPLPVLEE